MLGTILKSAVVGVVLGVGAATAAPDQTGQQPAPAPSDPAGSSTAVPPGKVTLPPIPYAKTPDTTMPNEPDVAPLPAAPPDQGATPRRS